MMHACEPFRMVHPTHNLVRPRVHHAHLLKSAALKHLIKYYT